MDGKEGSIVRNIVIKTERLLLARKAFGVTHFCAGKMRSMEYERVEV